MSLFAENKRFFAMSKVAVYSLSEMKILSVSYMSCSESLLKTKKKEANKTYFGEVILCQLKIAEQERPQSDLYSVCINPFTPKISSVILLTICHAILTILVWRIRHWIG